MGNWPGAGRLTGMLEGLMVTVQHKHYGGEQLVHPLQAEEDTKVEGEEDVKRTGEREIMAHLGSVFH